MEKGSGDTDLETGSDMREGIVYFVRTYNTGSDCMGMCGVVVLSIMDNPRTDVI